MRTSQPHHPTRDVGIASVTCTRAGHNLPPVVGCLHVQQKCVASVGAPERPTTCPCAAGEQPINLGGVERLPPRVDLQMLPRCRRLLQGIVHSTRIRARSVCSRAVRSAQDHLRRAVSSTGHMRAAQEDLFLVLLR